VGEVVDRYVWLHRTGRRARHFMEAVTRALLVPRAEKVSLRTPLDPRGLYPKVLGEPVIETTLCHGAVRARSWRPERQPYGRRIHEGMGRGAAAYDKNGCERTRK
jgi:hypothetical protein